MDYNDRLREAIIECKGYNSWGALDDSVIQDVAYKYEVKSVDLQKELV